MTIMIIVILKLFKIFINRIRIKFNLLLVGIRRMFYLRIVSIGNFRGLRVSFIVLMERRLGWRLFRRVIGRNGGFLIRIAGFGEGLWLRSVARKFILQGTLAIVACLKSFIKNFKALIWVWYRLEHMSQINSYVHNTSTQNKQFRCIIK